MDRTEKIVVLDNEVQAELVDNILSDRDIPHVMRSYHDVAFDGVFQGQMGWGHIEAPESFRNEILSIVEEVKQRSEEEASTSEGSGDEGK
jgi:hypothetical protein